MLIREAELNSVVNNVVEEMHGCLSPLKINFENLIQSKFLIRVICINIYKQARTPEHKHNDIHKRRINGILSTSSFLSSKHRSWDENRENRETCLFCLCLCSGVLTCFCF